MALKKSFYLLQTNVLLPISIAIMWCHHRCAVAKVILDLQISKSVGREWQPISNVQLHLAVKDPHADAEMAYLETLLQDQAF